jgi:hypothetical protein
MSAALIIVSLIVVLFVGSVVGTRLHLSRIARRREGEGFSDFAAHFVNGRVPHEVLVNTYGYFGEWNTVAGELFPVRPADNISDVYGCAEEDLDDAVEEILRKSGRRPFTQVEMPQPPRVETVDDVVLYVAAAPVVHGRE